MLQVPTRVRVFHQRFKRQGGKNEKWEASPKIFIAFECLGVPLMKHDECLKSSKTIFTLVYVWLIWICRVRNIIRFTCLWIAVNSWIIELEKLRVIFLRWRRWLIKTGFGSKLLATEESRHFCPKQHTHDVCSYIVTPNQKSKKAHI